MPRSTDSSLLRRNLAELLEARERAVWRVLFGPADPGLVTMLDEGIAHVRGCLTRRATKRLATRALPRRRQAG